MKIHASRCRRVHVFGILAIMVSLFLSACGRPTGLGAISLTNTEEREASAVYLWTIRGADAGELVRAYCMWGSTRERKAMFEALERYGRPAVVTIACPENGVK